MKCYFILYQRWGAPGTDGESFFEAKSLHYSYSSSCVVLSLIKGWSHSWGREKKKRKTLNTVTLTSLFKIHESADLMRITSTSLLTCLLPHETFFCHRSSFFSVWSHFLLPATEPFILLLFIFFLVRLAGASAAWGTSSTGTSSPPSSWGTPPGSSSSWPWAPRCTKATWYVSPIDLW